MTPCHAEQLAVLCDRVVMMSDGDKAGEVACERWTAVLRGARVRPFRATLPAGCDPDDLDGPKLRATVANALTPPSALDRAEARIRGR
jgi:DNA primase